MRIGSSTPIPLREADVQRAILQYLSMRGHVCWRNNSGAMALSDARGKKRFLRFGAVGSGDIIGLTKPDGKFFSIEVKRRGNTATDAQKDFIGRVVQSGGISFVAYDVQDVIDRGF